MLIDTLGTDKHIRHVVAKEHEDGSVTTLCNRHVRYFSSAIVFGNEPVSYFYGDGTRFSYPCKTCLPQDPRDSALPVKPVKRGGLGESEEDWKWNSMT